MDTVGILIVFVFDVEVTLEPLKCETANPQANTRRQIPVDIEDAAKMHPKQGAPKQGPGWEAMTRCIVITPMGVIQPPTTAHNHSTTHHDHHPPRPPPTTHHPPQPPTATTTTTTTTTTHNNHSHNHHNHHGHEHHNPLRPTNTYPPKTATGTTTIREA